MQRQSAPTDLYTSGFVFAIPKPGEGSFHALEGHYGIVLSTFSPTQCACVVQGQWRTNYPNTPLCWALDDIRRTCSEQPHNWQALLPYYMFMRCCRAGFMFTLSYGWICIDTEWKEQILNSSTCRLCDCVLVQEYTPRKREISNAYEVEANIILSFSSKIIGTWRHTRRTTLDHAGVGIWYVFSFPLWTYYFLLHFFLLYTCLRVCSWVFQSLSTCISIVRCFLCWVCLICLVFIAWFFLTSFLVSSSDKLAALNCRFSDFIGISLNISHWYLLR